MNFTIEQKLRIFKKIWGQWTIKPILEAGQLYVSLTNYQENLEIPQFGIVNFTGPTIEGVVDDAIVFLNKTLRLDGELKEAP